MNYQWIGAILIIGSCGGFGISIAAQQRREEQLLQQLCLILHFMENELRYRLTPLPELARLSSREVRGSMRKIFSQLARDLDNQSFPDVSACMSASLLCSPEIPRRVRRMLRLLGQSLGRFELSGQLKGLRTVQNLCSQEIDALRFNRDVRLRSFRILGFCAGVALAVLLI